MEVINSEIESESLSMTVRNDKCINRNDSTNNQSLKLERSLPVRNKQNTLEKSMGIFAS